MVTYKDRLINSTPIFTDLLSRQNLVNQTVAAGGVAGEIAVTGILLGDDLNSVINLTDGTDITSEFTLTKDGTIDNTGGGTTAGDTLLVNWTQWAVR